MLDTLASLLCLVAILLSAYVPGRAVTRAWCGPLDLLGTFTWSLAIGLVCSGIVLTFAGVLGLFDRVLIALVTVGLALGGGLLLGHDLRGWQLTRPAFLFPGNPAELSTDVAPRRDVLWGAGGMALLTVVASLVSALAPPTAGDALCYHLDLPKSFLLAGGFLALPYDENATYPLLVEMWYLWALALEGGVTAQLMHWVLGLLLAAGTIELARPVLGKSWSLLVGAVTLLVPGVSNQMTAPLNDVALAAFTTLGLAAGQRAWLQLGSPRWYLVAGLMGGAAVATKYTALLFVPALGVVLAREFYRHSARRRELLVQTATIVCVVISVAGIWYVRAAWQRGNPVYPFLSNHIGQTGPAGQAEKTPLTAHPRDLVRAAWDVTMRPEHFGGRGHEWGPLYLALLPGLLFVRRLRGLTMLLQQPHAVHEARQTCDFPLLPPVQSLIEPSCRD